MLKNKKIHTMATIILLLLSLSSGLSSAGEGETLPLSVHRVLYQAQTLIAEDRPEEAQMKLEAYRDKKQHSHYMIEFTLGDIRMLKEAWPQAAEAYRRALDLKQDFAPAWMNLGKASYEMADYSTAADCFYKAYRAEAEPHPEWLYYSATAHLLARDPARGLVMFRTLLKTHPTAVTLAWKPTLVQLYLALDQPAAALPVIEELAAQSTPPQKIQWQETLLGHYLLLGREDRALAYARELTRLNPTAARWWKALAHLLLQQEAFEEALQALMIYTKVTDPSQAEKKLLADLSLQAGIPVMAVHYYQELAAASLEEEIVTSLAYALRRLGRQTEALQQIESFLAKQAAPDLLWMKGELLYEMKRYTDAAATFRLCALDPSLAGKAWLMAGYASWQAKNIIAARVELTRAAAYPKQQKSARAALKELENITSDY